ncbi:MAG: ATP-binding protein [Phycisphaera sp.]|nr:MAG: ATP-binding protein [Phycisphaera sp.]
MTASDAASIPANNSGGSPPFVTGGGGFAYEDRVAAYLLAAMLAEQPPFGEELGVVVRVDWQTGASGWRFDDLLATCEAPEQRHIAISCKAGGHVTAGGWPEDTVTRIWEHWVSPNNNPFQRSSDLLAVVTETLALDAKRAWDRILSEALVGDSTRFMQQYQTAGSSSDAGRNIVDSLSCPTDLIGQVIDEPGQRFEVIRHIRVWTLDVLATDSAAITRAIEWCRSALVSGDRTEAERLFQFLVSLASERRPRSGTLAKRELLELLATGFALTAAPSHEASWNTLDAHSEELLGDVRTTINDVVCFTHLDTWPHILRAAIPGRVVLLEGESGSGKSALATRLARGRRRTLWLSASNLEHATLTAVGNQLGATVPFSTLVDEERSTDGLLVIDGAERLTETGLRTAAKLVATALKAANPWLAVITTHEGGADALAQEIGNLAQNAEPIQSVEIHLPSEEAIQKVISALGVTLSAKATPSLLRVLRNLKALDWVAKATQRKHLKSFPDLVDQVWKGFIGFDNGRARSEVLKRLGKEDAAVIVGGVSSSTLSGGGEQQVVETLIRDGLLNARRERLFFRHDLLGDWARLLVLIESGESVSQVLKEASTSLRWEPAIRLFAEWLLQEGDAERQRLVSLIAGDPLSPGSTALLEGLFRSPDCGPVLAVILDHPALSIPKALNGLLNAFVSVATRPATKCRMITKAHPESASIREAFRTPLHELWPAVMAVMETKAEQLAQRAPIRLGAVVRRWLSDVQTVVRQDLVSTHLGCSRLAVASARELQARIAESRYMRTEGAAHTFEAALYAAPWLPEEVASLALELATRRPEPQFVKDRVEAEQKRVAEEITERLAKIPPEERMRRQGTLSLGPTPRRKRAPLPDGPAGRVNEEFRNAVFGTGVLVRLMAARPAAAQEVLLACCLEDPSDEDPLHTYHYHGDHTGTVDPMGWYPPLYLRGPWLALLGQLPEQGLDAVMRLVAAGTTEWLRLNIPRPDHVNHDWIVRVTTVTLMVGDTERVFRGDHDVFGWYRGYGRAGSIVASALMALESWLYGLVDANQPVDWAVKRILESGSSVALLGVLGALARKKHELLDGILRPLIQSWMVLDWDEHLSRQANLPSFDPFGLKVLNSVYDNESERWSALPHRKIGLPWLIAQKLAFGQVEIEQTCADARAVWQAELDSDTCLSSETVARLVALLDPKNLTLVQQSDGQLILSVQWPPQLQAKYDEKSKSASAGITGFQLRQVVRKLLDDPYAMSDEQAELIWSAASSLPDPDSNSGENAVTIVDARAAVAAALENHACAWLDKYPDRRGWCELAAVEAVRDRAKQESLASGISMFTEYGESFAGAWGVARLAAGDAREVVRRVVAEAMTAREHIVTGQVLAAAIRLAARMPGELERLFNLTWLWAALRNLPSGTWESEAWRARIAAVRRQRLIDAYVNKRIPSAPIPWEDLRLRAARISERHERRREARRPQWGLEAAASAPLPLPSTWTEYHSHGFNWSLLEKVIEPRLPYVVRPSLDPSLRPLVEFDQRLLDLALWTMMRAPQRHRYDSSDSLPGMLGRHTLNRAASLIAGHEDESKAIGIWRTLAPHLARHHHWAEAFFDSWFACSRTDAEQAKQFHQRWQKMIAHADSLQEWKSTDGEKRYSLRKAKSALLGVHKRGSKLGVVEDQPFLANMVDRYETWATEYAADSWLLRSFCFFLQKPGAVDLRLPAMSWVRDALKSLAEYRAADKDLVSAIVALCVMVWYQKSQAVLADPEARSALIDIVQHLSHLQVQEVKELKADVEAGMAQNPADRSVSDEGKRNG